MQYVSDFLHRVTFYKQGKDFSFPSRQFSSGLHGEGPHFQLKLALAEDTALFACTSYRTILVELNLRNW